MSELYNSRSKGEAGGVFGTCFLVGNLFSLLLSGYALSYFGWRTAFILPSVILVLFAILFNLGIGGGGGSQKKGERNSALIPKVRISIFSYEVLVVAAVYVLLQFVRSGFNLWVPAYV